MAVVGRGSNLLVADEGFRGLVLRLVGRLTSISVRGTGLWCGGGASLPRAVQRAAAHGLAGLEFGASIPGTAGGAVAMNAGAHAGELAQVLDWAVLCSPGDRRRVGPDRPRARVPEVGRRAGRGGGRRRLRPPPRGPRRDRGAPRGVPGPPAGDPAPGRADLRERLHQPPGDSAGRLLEAAGCKGLQVGGARFSPVHANFIEARPGCRSADVLALMAAGRARVAAAGGPVLVPEVRYLDPERGVTHPPLPAP